MIHFKTHIWIYALLILTQVAPLLSRQVIPCAWLETGGVFSSRRISSRPVYFVRPQLHCPTSGLSCSYKWETSVNYQVLNFQLIGTDDMRSYRFQAHFCDEVYHRGHSTCRSQRFEVTYTMVQIGTWLLLDRVHCICTGTAEVLKYTYKKAIYPYENSFPVRAIYFTCTKTLPCQDGNAACYSEVADPYGQIKEGDVLCRCPEGYFCPLYFIGSKRELRSGYHRQYIIRCRKNFF